MVSTAGLTPGEPSGLHGKQNNMLKIRVFSSNVNGKKNEGTKKVKNNTF